MACCYTDELCDGYAVSPRLQVPCYTECDERPLYVPCLPRCPKVVYVNEKKRSKTPSDSYQDQEQKYSPPRRERCLPMEREYCSTKQRDCCAHMRRESCPHTHRENCPPPPCCDENCCQPPCKPVKTKYVIPCYRYEDGRITNQPTVLMHRACEVAVGRRKKPFVESSFSADQSGEVRRYASEDEKGNCCYHFERKKPCYTDPQCHPCESYQPCQPQPCQPCQPRHPRQPGTSRPECQFVECKAIDTCCYYC